jgi:serine/threonine protein kinase
MLFFFFCKEKNQLKIVGFENAMIRTNNNESKRNDKKLIDAQFRAPELFNTAFLPSKESDIWSFGMILYLLLCGSLPFFNNGGEKAQRDLVSELFLYFCLLFLIVFLFLFSLSLMISKKVLGL